MSVIKTALVAASLVTMAAAANAQSREDLNSGIHGNTPVWSTPYDVRTTVYDDARGAYARSAAPDRYRNGHRVYRPAYPRSAR